MNNKTIRISLGALAVGAIALVAQNAEAQVTNYNNTTSFQGDFSYGSSTSSAIAGNEVILAGGPTPPSTTPETITSFSFQYFLTATGSGDVPSTATADLIFYQNNGTQVSGSSSPGTVLFNSGPISLSGQGLTTGSTLALSSGYVGTVGTIGTVAVPSIFTWAVSFSGLDSAESAGLALYSTTTAGANYGDAWYNATGTGTWALETGTPAVTFGAVATTVPEPSTLGMFAMASCGLLASGWRKLRR
jgi:hypothetical protein